MANAKTEVKMNQFTVYAKALEKTGEKNGENMH